MDDETNIDETSLTQSTTRSKGSDTIVGDDQAGSHTTPTGATGYHQTPQKGEWQQAGMHTGGSPPLLDDQDLTYETGAGTGTILGEEEVEEVGSGALHTKT